MTEKEQNKIEKDILFQIDNLGTIYAYKDIMDLEEAEKDKEIKLLREAVKKLQSDIEIKNKVIDYTIEEIHSIVNLGEFIDRNIDNLDTKEEIKEYFYKEGRK